MSEENIRIINMGIPDSSHQEFLFFLPVCVCVVSVILDLLILSAY